METLLFFRKWETVLGLDFSKYQPPWYFAILCPIKNITLISCDFYPLFQESNVIFLVRNNKKTKVMRKKNRRLISLLFRMVPFFFLLFGRREMIWRNFFGANIRIAVKLKAQIKLRYVIEHRHCQRHKHQTK